MLRPWITLGKGLVAVVWILYGVSLCAFVLPWHTTSGRTRVSHRWSKIFLKTLGIRVHADPLPPMPQGHWMLISNHVSWIDIFVILSVVPIRFVSKAEVKKWPVAGYLASSAGTLYLDRTRKRDTASMSSEMRAVIENHELVGIFPEGTTTDGSIIRPFFSSLMQPAIQTRATLLPAGLRYETLSGERNTTIPFIGSQTFVGSFAAILKEPGAQARVKFGDPISTEGTERRALAERAEAEVAKILNAQIDPDWQHPD